MRVYLETQPDYIHHSYTLNEFKDTLRLINEKPQGKQICLSDKGFDLAGRIYQIWQSVKEFFGFLSKTNQARVELELLKIIFYGAKENYLDDKEVTKIINMIHEKCEEKTLPFSETTRQICSEYLNKEKEERCDYIREQIEQFHAANQEQLSLGFFHRNFFATETEVSDHFQFGDTYLSLAEDVANEGSPWDIQDIQNTLDYYFEAAQFYHSTNTNYTTRLRTSFYYYEQSIKHRNRIINQKLAKINLLLAEREYNCKHAATAKKLFDRVEKYDANALESRHLVMWMRAALAEKDKPSIESIKKKLETKGLNEVTKPCYIDACLFLGEASIKERPATVEKRGGLLRRIFFGNEEQPKLSQEHLEKAIKHYHEAWIHMSDPREQLKCLNTIKTIFHSMDEKEEWRKTFLKTGLSCISKKYHLRAAQYLTLAIQYSDPKELFTAKVGLESVHHLATLISHIYTTQPKAVTNSLLDMVFDTMGDIKSCFSLEVQKHWFSQPTHELNCLVPGLTNDNFKFMNDVGAKLYFYKAELMRELQPEKRHQINEYYQMATHLAPGNPFGSGSLFMVDDQASAADNIDKMIAINRNLALAWLTV